MIFSNEPNKLLGELRDLLPFACSYDAGRMVPLLVDTERTYLVPLLGEKLYGSLSDAEALRLCRKAVANITVYENFTLLNTQILPGGFARLTGDNTSTLYKYQEQDLKDTFRRNGFDQLDVIVNYLLNHVEKFPEFEESEYFTAGRGEIVPDRLVFSRHYKPVGHIVFRYLQPFIRRAEDLDVSQVVDLAALRSALLADSLTGQQIRILELVRPVLVCLAVTYAIEDMGVNISDAGVWLENRVAADGMKERNPLFASQAETAAAKYRQIAARYLQELQNYISGTAGKANPLNRDNRDKKTVWL